MQEVIAAIMDRTKDVIALPDYDAKSTPFRLVDPTTAQQYHSIESYHQREEIADDLHNEYII